MVCVCSRWQSSCGRREAIVCSVLTMALSKPAGTDDFWVMYAAQRAALQEAPLQRTILRAELQEANAVIKRSKRRRKQILLRGRTALLPRAACVGLPAGKFVVRHHTSLPSRQLLQGELPARSADIWIHSGCVREHASTGHKHAPSDTPGKACHDRVVPARNVCGRTHRCPRFWC